MAGLTAEQFNAHAMRCERLLGQVNDPNRLNDEEKKAFEAAQLENHLLKSQDSAKLYTAQLDAYNTVLTDILNNQEQWPTPRLGL